MTTDDIEQDALECWDLYRRMARQDGRNEELVPSLELWVIAYAAGVELGRELEREACAVLADGCGLANLASMIRSIENEDDELEDAA